MDDELFKCRPVMQAAVKKTNTILTKMKESAAFFFQPKLKIGADFSRVRILTGSSSAGLNQELGARAFTKGSDIYFN